MRERDTLNNAYFSQIFFYNVRKLEIPGNGNFFLEVCGDDAHVAITQDIGFSALVVILNIWKMK